MLETAEDMHRSGILDTASLDKITARHRPADAAPARQPLSPQEIRRIRARTRMSQAVFARYLNVTAGYVSQLERGAKHPTGAALALLNVIRRKGIEAIL
ncbi:MAG TPA: helix-turn-helix domain-containing protein [Rhizomicrobium sp.]